MLTGNCSNMKRIGGTSVDDSREDCIMQQWTLTSTPLTQPLLQQSTGGNTIADQQSHIATYAIGLLCIIGIMLTYLCKRTPKRKKTKGI